MTEVNTTKFYQFLSKYQKDGETWADVADSNYGNDDGTVIKAEFRKFINAEWNGEENGELSNDLINSFWKKIDTNTSATKISGTKLRNLNALDKNEMANLDKQLEVYVQFDKFVEENVKIPNVLSSTGSQWKTAVVDELTVLLEAFIAGGANGDLNAILNATYQTIANEQTALYCAVEYQETLKDGILKDYPEYKVADDKTLDALIKEYIKTVGADVDAKQIREDIISIMDSYLQTADIGDGGAYAIEDLGYDGTKLNDLQVAVITATIKKDLAEEAKKYEGYEEEFNKAVQQFIDEKIKKGGTFEELKGAATEFANSKYKEQLDNTVTINTTYRDVTEDSDFYAKLIEEFGETLAKKIAQNDRYIQAYKDIINDVAAKVNAGEMTMDEVADYIIKQISANLEKFFANGLGDMTIEELNSTYDKLAAAADEQKDDEASLQQHRDAAIKYCDALAKKGDEFKNLIKEVFGTNDYKTTINSLLPGEIQDLMDDLKTKALDTITKIEGSKATDCTWNNAIKTQNTAETGSSLSINVGANINLADGSTTAPDSYQATIVKGAGNGAEVSILNNGVMTVKTPNIADNMTIEVYAIKDGEKVGEPITIQIKVEENAASIINRVTDWGGAKSEHLETIGVNQGQQVTSSDFASLYNGDAMIQLEYNESSKGWNERKDLVKTRLTSLGNHIISALTTAGLDKAKLTKATNTVVNKYMSSHVSYKWSSGSGSEGSLRNKVNTKFKENADARHSIVEVYDKTGTDSHIFAVSFKDFVDDIIAEYNKL